MFVLRTEPACGVCCVIYIGTRVCVRVRARVIPFIFLYYYYTEYVYREAVELVLGVARSFWEGGGLSGLRGRPCWGGQRGWLVVVRGMTGGIIDTKRAGWLASGCTLKVERSV